MSDKETDRVVKVDPDVDGPEAFTKQHADYVMTAVPPIAKTPAPKGKCEHWTKADAMCPRVQKFWVQRGPVGQLVCGQHLQQTIEEFHAIKPGRYGRSEHYEGYWVRNGSSVVVKMKVGDGWR